MKKIIILFTIGFILGAVLVYFFVFNKDHKKIEQATITPIAVDVLLNAFEQNEQAANQQYLNKALAITGIPSEITINQTGQSVLFFSEDGISGVQCTLRDSNIQVPSNKTLIVEGFCNGYTTAVLLSDCILKN